MFVTEEGITMDVSEPQELKAQVEIDVIEFGIINDVISEHPAKAA